MSANVVICQYIVGSFLIIKTGCEVFMELAQLTLDSIYTVANAILKLIQYTLQAALEAVLAAVKVALNGANELLAQVKPGKWFCSNLNKCQFIKDQIINPGSLINKMVMGIWDKFDSDGSMDKTQQRFKDSQQWLYEIWSDFDTFQEQICNGLSFDLGLSALKELMQKCEAQINEWYMILEKKLNSIKRMLQGYIDMLKGSGFFDLLDELKAFFNCILDTTFCATVETSKSFYKECMKKCGLVDNGDGEYGLSTALVEELTGPVKSFLETVGDTKRKIKDVLRAIMDPISAKGANNAFNLNSTIRGIGRAAKAWYNGDDKILSHIPIVSYCRHKVDEIWNIWHDENKENTDSFDTVFLNAQYYGNVVRIYGTDYTLPNSEGNDDSGEAFEISPDADTSCLNDCILVNGNVYTVSEATMAIWFMQNNPSKLDPQYTDLYNYCNDMHAIYTDLLDVSETAEKY